MKIQVRSKKNPIHYNTKNLKLLQNSQIKKTTTGGCVVGRENETLLMLVGGMVASS